MQQVVPVKRVSVSANVEIFRNEFPSLSEVPSVYHDTVPTCKKCQRERNRNRDFRQNKKIKRKQNRANTPIVIQLKDTLKAAILQKQKTRKNLLQKQESKENRDEGDNETDNNSDKSDLVFKTNRQRKNVKNISAFIEKSTRKDTSSESHCNLSYDNPSHDKFVAEYVLNNITDTHLLMKGFHKKNIVECENVDIICNDLNSTESTLEDTEESEISSTTSSSEIQSDSDISNPHDSPPNQEFTQAELQQLAEFTTGCPLVRYDCAPSSCPQCLWYKAQVDLSHGHNYQHAQPYHQSCSSKQQQHTYRSGRRNKSKKFAQQNQKVPSPRITATVKVKNISHTESDLEEATTDSPSESSNDTDTLSLEGQSPVSKHGSFNWSDQYEPYNYQPMQLVDIDFAGKQSKSHYSTSSEPYIDGVYMDLTNTDVTFSVYYHHSLTEESSTYSAGSYAEYTSSNITGTHHHDYLPYNTVPYLQQYTYWSTYYAPVCSVPMPLCLQPDESLPKTAMVPPEELAKFNATSPPQRQWIPLARPEPGRPAAIFTVMCYNVLCDKYCTRQQYGYCPSWGLNWEYRKKGIIDEIRQCSADIIGLQEVETDQFYNFFKIELERDGYQGIFSPKSRARTMTEQERKHVDGCAIFFRTSKFSLVKEHLIEFNQLAMLNAEGSDEMLNRVMTKDNIGLAALLETREGVFDSSGGLPPEDKLKQPILITTAHMHWDPEFSDVKLIQTMMLMSELKKVVEDSYQAIRPDEQMADCNSIPMILCGDLNSLPESGVIEYLSTGRVASNHTDFKELGYEACLQAFNCHKDSTHLTHKFRLAKAYEDNIMRHTNYTFEFKGIIDYIFFSRSYMNLLGVLGPMDENWFHEHKVVGCPHPHIPSDHFSLFVEFEMPVPYPDINTILSDHVPVSSNTGNNLGAIGSSRDKHHR